MGQWARNLPKCVELNPLGKKIKVVILGLEWHGGNETVGDASLVNLTGMQYAILNAYQFIDLVEYTYRDEETGVLWVCLVGPLTIVVGIESDGQLIRGEKDRV
ncbi:hypothetical protein Syn6312_1496 [Synechococcus sp. PCC 6312]|nr:hypothetical protein Syn6312_1496 [Synechococcus sp. PCC 6312]